MPENHRFTTWESGKSLMKCLEVKMSCTYSTDWWSLQRCLQSNKGIDKQWVFLSNFKIRQTSVDKGSFILESNMWTKLHSKTHCFQKQSYLWPQLHVWWAGIRSDSKRILCHFDELTSKKFLLGDGTKSVLSFNFFISTTWSILDRLNIGLLFLSGKQTWILSKEFYFIVVRT